MRKTQNSVLEAEFLLTPHLYKGNARSYTTKYAKKYTLRQLKHQILGDDVDEKEDDETNYKHIDQRKTRTPPQPQP